MSRKRQMKWKNTWKIKACWHVLSHLASTCMTKNTKLCGHKRHWNREVLRGSKIEPPSDLSYFAILTIYGPKDFENNVHLPWLFEVIQPSRHLQLKWGPKYWTERRTKPLLSELETQLIIAKCNKNTHKNKKLTLKCFDLCKFGDRKSSLWALLERMHRWDVWNFKRKASWGSWFVLLTPG